MLNRSRGMLDRGLLHRLMNHRSACPTVAGRTAGASALDDGAGVRRRGVTANAASGTCAALDRRAMSSSAGRTVLSGDAAVAGNAAAASERGALLAEDAAVSSTARSEAATSSPTGRAAARSDTAVSAAARCEAGGAVTDPDPSACASVAAHTCPTGNSRRRGMGGRLAAHCGALAAQNVGATCTTDAQAGAPSSGGTALTTDADARERTGHMRSSCTVQGSALTCDQSCLTAGSHAQRCIARRASIAGTSEPTASAKTGLASQSGLAAQRRLTA